MAKSPYIEYLEERRDAWKALAEGAKIILPALKKVLNEKIERDLVELFREEDEK